MQIAGPVGQCHPIPDEPQLKAEMRKHARNYMRIYNQYNIPYHARPGDDLFAAARLDVLQKMGAEVYERVANGQDQEEAQKEVEEKYLSGKVIYIALRSPRGIQILEDELLSPMIEQWDI